MVAGLYNTKKELICLFNEIKCDIIRGIDLYDDCLLEINCTGDLLVLNEDIVEICDYAIENAFIRKIILPKNLKKISGASFDSDYLSEIEVDDKNPNFSNDKYGVLFNKDKTQLIRCPSAKSLETYKLPDTVKSICSYAFDGCNIKNIILPKSLEDIHINAFYYCNVLNIKYVGTEKEFKNIKGSKYIGQNNSLKDENIIFDYKATLMELIDEGYTFHKANKIIKQNNIETR